MSRPRSVRARRALLWGLASFTALQLGLAAATLLWLPQLRDPYYGYKAVRLRQRLQQASCARPGLTASVPPAAARGDAGAPLVLVLGSSRTIFGVNTRELEPQLRRELGRPVVAFNFGTLGAGPLTELLHLRRLLDDGIRPDLLLVEVLPPLLAGQGPAAWAELNRLPASRLWLKDLDLIRHHGGPDAALRRDWWQGLPVPWYSQRFALVSAAAPAWLPLGVRQDWSREADDTGWVDPPRPSTTPEERRRCVERDRKEYGFYWDGFRPGGPAGAALRETVALCRREGIAVALLLLPEASEFRGWYPPGANAAIDEFLGGLRRDFGVPVIDAREWVADAGFVDSHHLLPAGATAFTGRLGREVIVPLLEGRRPAGETTSQGE